jgi:Complex 1 protein (LYR family)
MAKVVTPREVLSAYRHLLRSIAITFKGDNSVMVAARTTARTKFDEAKTLDPASEEALKGLEEARGASTFLRQAVIQGVKEDDSANFRISCVCLNADCRITDT